MAVNAPDGVVSVQDYNQVREDVEALRVKLEEVEWRVAANRRLREDYEAVKTQAEEERVRADNESGKLANLQIENSRLLDNENKFKIKVRDLTSANSSLRKELDEVESRVVDTDDELDVLIEHIEDVTEYEHTEG